MSGHKRKNRKELRKRLIRFFLYTCFCLLIAGIGAFFYFLQARIPLYISPLPKGVLGNETSEKDRNISIIQSEFKKMHVEYVSIAKSQDSYTITLKNKSKIILSAQKDIKSQLSSLQFILTRLTMEGRLFSQLDLRFDKPVIRSK